MNQVQTFSYDEACEYLMSGEVKTSGYGLEEYHWSELDELQLPGFVEHLPQLLQEKDRALFQKTCQWLTFYSYQLSTPCFDVILPLLFHLLKTDGFEYGYLVNGVVRSMNTLACLPVLIDLTNNPDLGVQEQAVRALGDLDFHLKNLIAQQPAAHRMEMEKHLSSLPYRAGIPILLQILNDNQREPKVRQCAASSLGNLCAYGAVPDFLNALTHPHEALRIGAAGALGDLQIPEAIPGLITAMLTDSHEWVRGISTQSLGQFPQRAEWLSYFKRAVSDPCRSVGYVAAQILTSLDPHRYIFGIKHTEDWALADRLETPNWEQTYRSFVEGYEIVHFCPDCLYTPESCV